jgi:uncharacterized glyoxalase superfamily protein PhnB
MKKMRLVATTMLALVFTLMSGLSYAEDLTTLDGKTFTNITEVAKYPGRIYFTFDEKRISIAITNLPQEFQTNHGIIIETNAVKTSIEQITKTNSIDFMQQLIQQTNSTDLFLASNTNSILKATKEVDKTDGGIFYSWVIEVTADGFKLESSDLIGEGEHEHFHMMTASFKFNQEDFAITILNKAIDWGKIAYENNAEPFEKPIGNLSDDSYLFYWDEQPKTGISLHGPEFIFDQDAVVNFINLIQSLPSLKQELALKIRNQQAQQDLFK